MAKRVVRALDLQYGSLGPGSALGEKGKKIGDRSEPRSNLGRGKPPFPPPQDTAIFFLFDPFFLP